MTIKATDFWKEKTGEIASAISMGGIEDFISWSVIQATMWVGDAPYMQNEYDEVVKYFGGAGDIASTRPGGIASELPENRRLAPYGDILFKRYGWCSTNMIHQAYHLLILLREIGVAADSFDSILEFGGGYGAMARVFYNAGYRKKYTLVDTLPMLFLQSAYLSDLPADIHHETSFCNTGDVDLLIGLWSLSESPPEVTRELVEATRPNVIFVAYSGDNEFLRFIEDGGYSVRHIKCHNELGYYFVAKREKDEG